VTNPFWHLCRPRQYERWRAAVRCSRAAVLHLGDCGRMSSYKGPDVTQLNDQVPGYIQSECATRTGTGDSYQTSRRSTGGIRR
jgi:hypothetical protein